MISTQTTILDAYAQLKLLSEVVPESLSPNGPVNPDSHALGIRENATALSLALDLIFDHGVPQLREKSAFLALLEKADLISKASGMISGTQSVMNTAHGRVCS